MALAACLDAIRIGLGYTGSILVSVPLGVYVGKRLVLARYEWEAAKKHSCLNCHLCDGWGCNRNNEEKENPNKNPILRFFYGSRR